MDFLTIVERVGIPVGILVFFGLAVWRVLKWIGEKVVTPIAASHIALVDEARKVNEQNAETLNKLTEISESKSKALVQILGQNTEALRLIQQTYDLIRDKEKR